MGFVLFCADSQVRQGITRDETALRVDIKGLTFKLPGDIYRQPVERAFPMDPRSQIELAIPADEDKKEPNNDGRLSPAIMPEAIPALVLEQTPSFKKLLSELGIGLGAGGGFAAGTIWIVVAGIRYAIIDPTKATFIGVTTGLFYPTTGTLFSESNSIILMGEKAELEPVLQIRLASHAANFLIGLLQNAALITFAYTAGSPLYGNDVDIILIDYLKYNFATHILLLVNNADIHVSILLREKYAILAREMIGVAFGAGLYTGFTLKQLYGTYFLPGIDNIQQISSFITNCLHLRYQYKKMYSYANRSTLAQDMCQYLKLGLPSLAITFSASAADMTIILFLARYPDFLSGYQMVALLILPLVVIQSIFEAEITRTLMQYKNNPARVLLASSLSSFVFPMLLSISVSLSYKYFVDLITGDNNPALSNSVSKVLPYGLAGSLIDAFRSTLTGMLRGYNDQNIPALVNIIMTWTFVLTAIGAVLGEAPLETLNLSRNILAPLSVSAILAFRLYKRVNEPQRASNPTPVEIKGSSCLQFVSMWKRDPQQYQTASNVLLDPQPLQLIAEKRNP